MEAGEKICRVRGWAAFNSPLTIRLEDRSRKEIPCEITRLKRVDVQNQYQETEIDEKSGFFFEFHYDSVKEFYIVFEAGNVRSSVWYICSHRSALRRKLRYISVREAVT